MLLTKMSLSTLLIGILSYTLPYAVFATPPESNLDRARQLAKIKVLEVNRRTELSSWKQFLKSEDTAVVNAALVGVASARVKSALNIVRSLTKHADFNIVERSYFALAHLGELDPDALVERINRTKTAANQARLTRILGLSSEAFPHNFFEEVLNGGDTLLVDAVLAVKLQKVRSTDGAVLATDAATMANHLKNWSEQTQLKALQLLSASKETNLPYLAKLSKWCAEQTSVSLQAECLNLLSSKGMQTSEVFDAWKDKTDPQILVARSQALVRFGDVDRLAGQILAQVPAIKTGNLPVETSAFYGVMSPIKQSIRMKPSQKLKEAANAVYAAINLDGVSISGVTAGLGLGLSHLHCAAAALWDRNVQRIRRTRKCGAADYPQALRDMWKVESVIQWTKSKRESWLKTHFDGLAPRAQILFIEYIDSLGEPSKSLVLRKALASKVSAVCGHAARAIGNHRFTGLEAELVTAYRRNIERREFTVVESVLRALAKIEFVTAEDLFSRHRADPHVGIREAAIEGLNVIEAKRLREGTINRLETMQLSKRGFEPPPASVLSTATVDLDIVRVPAMTEYEILTTKGTFVIELLPQYALLGSKKLIRLALRSFFDGQSITLQRNGDIVVGDPDGLGWDGAGRNVPDEVHPTEVVTGTLLLARSGRDSATSRVVITRLPRPEYFGRANVVGRIVKGVESIAAVVEGDRILRIGVKENE